MVQINLIPDVKREFLKAKSLRNFVITTSILVTAGVAGLAIVLGVFLGGILVGEAVVSSSIKEAGQKLTSIEDLDKTVTIQQQLSRIDEQHANKSINSRLFDVMVAINPPAPNDVRISTLRMDPESGIITVEGSAVNGYAALEVFKKTIKNTKVQYAVDGESDELPLSEEITTGETSFGENSEGQRVLRFSINLSYLDELFKYSEDPVSIITPSGRIDVTDSKLGVPDSLFGRQADDIKEGEE